MITKEDIQKEINKAIGNFILRGEIMEQIALTNKVLSSIKHDNYYEHNSNKQKENYIFQKEQEEKMKVLQDRLGAINEEFGLN